MTSTRYPCISVEWTRLYVTKVTAVTYDYHSFDVNSRLLLAVLKASLLNNFVLKSPKGDFMC